MRNREDYVKAGRAAREAAAIVETVDELTEAVEGMTEKLNAFFRAHRFLPTTSNFEQLLNLPAKTFQPYVEDSNRQYEQGEVFAFNDWVILCQQSGRIQEPIRIEDNQLRPTMLKLFRGIESLDADGTARNWVREEFCIKGMQRYWQDTDPSRTGWYEVISARVDSSTPPPSDSMNWGKLPNE